MIRPRALATRERLAGVICVALVLGGAIALLYYWFGVGFRL